MMRAYKKRKSGQSGHDKKKRKKMEKGQCSYIPEEIQRQILVRLPVKSLLRFSSLNKWSHSLISTQQFINDHLITFRHKNKRQFLLSSSAPSNYNQDFQYVDGSVRPVYVQDLAPPPIGEVQDNLFRVVGYCDGVVCMIRSQYHIQLWNPSIRKMTLVVLSHSILRGPKFWKVDKYTFGFGSVDGEHKLVVFPMAESSLCTCTYIFSLKTQNCATLRRYWHWKVTSRRSEFVNGACHWLAWGRGVLFVLSFNLKKHTFGKIDLPNYLGSAFELSAYDGCLSLIARMERGRSSVWVMTKYGVVKSWTRIMEKKSLACLQDIVSITGGDAFGLAYCWFDSSKTRLVCYKTTRQRPEWLKADVKNLNDLHAYQESLVLLNQDVHG